MIGRRTLIAGSVGATGVALARRRGYAETAPEELKVAVSSTSFVLGGAKIGQQAGLFARNGLQFGIVVMESGNAAMSALIGGSVPFAVTGPPEVLAARVRGQDMVIVANLYAGFAGSLVLATEVAKRTGIATTAPVQERLHALDGLIIAVPSATSVLLAPIKEGAARTGATARFTYMAQPAMPAALESGAIQGFVASFPFAGAPVLRGTGVIWINGSGGELPADLEPSSSSVLQATTAYVAANQPTVRKLRQSFVDIANFIQKDPDAAKKALAASYPQLSAQEIDLAFAQQWRNWTKPFLTAADMQQELKLLIASTHAPGLDHLDPTAALFEPK
jgi:ABC-type nitrate/sulfonate/bicarbonate transport system substrate-binding protein